ncbi:MAG: LamG-like jellyroll fold domain-containing protein [Planctomycetota bacterium]|jgi:hypothetical protein
MKRALIFILVLAFFGTAQAKVDLAALPTRDTVRLTIYNSADLTLIRESRALTVKEGLNKLQFSWANTLIDPTSLEMLPQADADKIDITELVYPPRVKNLGLWNVESELSGKLPVEITYLTSGLTWRAFYMGTLTEDEKTMRLKGYVRVTNNSGEDYENAQVRLIVGKVHIIDQIAELARREHPYGRPGPQVVWAGEKGVESAGLEVKERLLVVADDAILDRRTVVKDVKKEGLSEYFLYTIEGTETIPTGWSKRLLSFDVNDVPVVNLYKFEQERYGKNVVRFLSFKNDEEHELGDTPIPGGLLKVYRNIDDAGHLSYTGQSSFKYIPVDEDVELNIGVVSDVVVEPVLMGFRTDKYTFTRRGDIAGWDEIRTFDVEVKNTREMPVKVEIQRNFETGDWELAKSGDFDDFEKVDFDTVKFTLELKPRATRKFSYVLSTHHEQHWKYMRDGEITMVRTENGELSVLQDGLKFDGRTSYVEVKDHPTLDLTAPLTLEAWVKFEQGGTENPRIISKGWETQSGYELLLRGTGSRRRFQFAAKNVGRFDSKSVLRAGRWYHLAATYDGRTVRLFVNGDADAAHRARGQLTTNDFALNFGRNSQTKADRYKGEIAEVRIWRRVLSQKDIRDNMYSFSSEMSRSLMVAWWDFRRYSGGDSAPDLSKHGNVAKIVRTQPAVSK